MSAHFNPEFDPADVNTDYGSTGGDITVPTFTADYSPFKFWCQKTLPLVFDDSLSYYEVLCKLVTYVNNLLTDLQTATGSIGTFAQQFVVNQQFLNQMAAQLGTNTAQLEAYINDRMEDFSEAYSSLQEYVNTYFANLDVQEEINTKLDAMAQDGTLDTLLQPFTEDWLENMTEEIRTDLANQNQTLTNQNARLSVLEGRMDTFSTLPAGSTSANAELVDIRTNFLGETYANAGEAVRASDLIASGYYPLMNSGHKDDQYLAGDGGVMDNACNTLSFDITKYKGGKLAYIFNVEYNVYENYEDGSLKIIGKGNSITPDSTMTEMDIFPANGYITLLRNYTESGSVVGQRLLFIRDIPEDETAQYYYLPYTDFQNQIPGEQSPDHLAPTRCVFPNYIFYVTNWSKTPVDDTLTQAGEAADAKATGDAITEVNERLDDVEAGYIHFTTKDNTYLSSTNGAETYYSGWKATDFISIEDKIEFYSESDNTGKYNAFYDANKTFISSFKTAIGLNIPIIPANAAYYRLSGPNANIDAIKIYNQTKIDINDNNTVLHQVAEIDKISNNIVTVNGNLVATEQWDATDFMPVFNEGPILMRYYIYGNGSLCFYDENKSLLLGISGNNASTYGLSASTAVQRGSITPPEGTRYIRMCVWKNYANITDLQYQYTCHWNLNAENILEKTDKVDSLSEYYKNKKVLVIGDSISSDAYGNYKKWVTDLIDEGKLSLANTTNSSQHATGFVARYSSGANDFISRITAIENKNTYDFVIVFGGINDYIQNIPLGGGSGETSITEYFKPAVDYFFNYLIENFTQARICVLLPLRTYNVYPNAAGNKQEVYSDYIHEVAKSYCLPVLNLTEESGFCPFVDTFKQMWTLTPEGYQTPDGTHPTADYEKKYLAPMIWKFISGLID